MTLDDFLLYVPRKWYQLFWFVLTLFNSVIVLAFIASLALPNLATTVGSYGVNTGVACAASIVLIYLLGPYWYVRRTMMALAALIGNMLTTFVIFYGLSAAGATSATSLPYVAALISMMTLTGMFGFPIVMGGFVVICIFVLAGYNFNVLAFSPYSWTLLAGSFGGIKREPPTTRRANAGASNANCDASDEQMSHRWRVESCYDRTGDAA